MWVASFWRYDVTIWSNTILFLHWKRWQHIKINFHQTSSRFIRRNRKHRAKPVIKQQLLNIIDSFHDSARLVSPNWSDFATATPLRLLEVRPRCISVLLIDCSNTTFLLSNHKGIWQLINITKGYGSCIEHKETSYKWQSWVVHVETSYSMGLSALTQRFDSEVDTCSNHSDHVDSLALVRPFVLFTYVQNAQCTGRQDNMSTVRG